MERKKPKDHSFKQLSTEETFNNNTIWMEEMKWKHCFNKFNPNFSQKVQVSGFSRLVHLKETKFSNIKLSKKHKSCMTCL